MHSRPKSSAEILATAKQAPQKEIRPRKSKTEHTQPLKERLSTLNFQRNTISDVPSLAAGSISSRPVTGNVHGLNNIQFKDPTTPHTLESAPEIKEGRDVMVYSDLEEILVVDELPTAWVLSICFNI